MAWCISKETTIGKNKSSSASTLFIQSNNTLKIPVMLRRFYNKCLKAIYLKDIHHNGKYPNVINPNECFTRMGETECLMILSTIILVPIWSGYFPLLEPRIEATTGIVKIVFQFWEYSLTMISGICYTIATKRLQTFSISLVEIKLARPTTHIVN